MTNKVTVQLPEVVCLMEESALGGRRSLPCRQAGNLKMQRLPRSLPLSPRLQRTSRLARNDDETLPRVELLLNKGN
ncbi:MAG: hypothetical protein V1933_03035 [Candidatus Omnitrophota bacterium]